MRITVCLLVLCSGLAAQEPADNEQLMIYELNRARQDPQRYDQEQGLGGILAGVQARPPLAINMNLQASSQFKSTEMADNDYFAHESAVTGDYANKLALDNGYPLASWLDPLGNNIESLAAGYLTVTTALAGLIEDFNINPPGHRYHLLATGPGEAFWAQMREIGIGYATNGGSTYVRYYTIHTGFRDADNPWLTGVVFNDINTNLRYDEGEGLGGVTINITGDATASFPTNGAGGWSFEAPAGNYTITVSGGAFAGVAVQAVVVGADNIEVDFRSGETEGEVGFEDQQVVGAPPPGGSSSGGGGDSSGGCHAIPGGPDFATSLGSWLLLLACAISLFAMRRL